MQTPASPLPLSQTPSQGALNWALGDYVMESVIRAGGRSTVYVARKHVGHVGPADGPDSLRALKVVSIGTDPEARTIADAERRGAELQQAFAQRHGLVPWVEAIGEARSCLYVAMELVPGEDLLDILGRGALPQERALDIAIQLATFLEKTHWFAVPGRAPERIIHADLKPGNVRVRPDGHVCVLDFGIAKAMAERRLETTQKWGTRQYMSPEWLQTGTIDEQVDYWSLGVLLYEMLAGYRPFRRFERHDNQLDDAIRRRERPEALPPRIRPALQTVVGRLLAREIAQRYASAADIRAALEACRPNGALAQTALARATPSQVALSPTTASEATLSPTASPTASALDVATEPALRTTRPDIATERVPAGDPPPSAQMAPLTPAGDGAQARGDGRLPLPHVVSMDADVPTLRAPWRHHDGAPSGGRSGGRITAPATSSGSDPIDSPPTERRPAPYSDPDGTAFAPAWNPAAADAAATSASASGSAFAAAGAHASTSSPASAGIAIPAPAAIPGAGLVAKALPRGVRWSQGRRLAIAVAWMIFAVIMATEGMACIAAERLRSDAAVADEGGLQAAVTRRTQLAGWTFFDVALRFRADPVIKDRLLSLADIVIGDYRQEQPTVGRTEWEKARGWLTEAVSLYPADRRLRARLRYTEAHVQRLIGSRRGEGSQARGARQSYYTAIQKFREAAGLDSSWPDPYLGLAHTYVYGLGDVENAVDALKGAEKRGYRETRRERAQIGDAYRARGERIWRSARDLEGDQQRDAYDRAEKDFKRCVEYFTPIVEFANAADQLRRCESRLADIEPHRTPWWRRLFDPDSDLQSQPSGAGRPNRLSPDAPQSPGSNAPATTEAPASPTPGSKEPPASQEPRTPVPVTPR